MGIERSLQNISGMFFCSVASHTDTLMRTRKFFYCAGCETSEIALSSFEFLGSLANSISAHKNPILKQKIGVQIYIKQNWGTFNALTEIV